jgi:CRISPR/Cas system-associated exonuclease Cas4 (RecB family)
MEKTSSLPPSPGEPFEKHWGAIQNGMFPMVYETLGGIEPEGVEKYLDKPHPGKQFNIHGYIDLIHSKGVITDFKTAAKSPPKNKATGEAYISNMHRLQLAYYAWLVSQGAHPVDVEIRTIVKTKVPKLVIAKTTISPKEMEMRLKIAQQVFDGIQNKVFTPNFGHWGCGPSKCLFWSECHGEFGGGDGDDE